MEEGEIPSVRRAALIFEIRETTLRNRYKGRRKTRIEGYKEQQWLTSEEENAMKRYCLMVDDLGFPLKYETLREIAQDLYSRSHEGEEQEFGENWIARYLRRHQEIKGKIAKALSRQRAMASDPEVICKFLQVAHDFTVQEKIPPKNIWNMDEKGFQMG